MKRCAFFLTQSIALIGVVVLTLGMAGCGTLQNTMAGDTPSGLVPSGHGAP